MSEKQQLRFALAALAAGLAWGFLRHRNHPHRTIFALFQGLEWFISYGGAVALIAKARTLLDEAQPDEDIEQRIRVLRHEMTEERTGIAG